MSAAPIHELVGLIPRDGTEPCLGILTNGKLDISSPIRTLTETRAYIEQMRAAGASEAFLKKITDVADTVAAAYERKQRIPHRHRHPVGRRLS
jgi:hypothetical protein